MTPIGIRVEFSSNRGFSRQHGESGGKHLTDPIFRWPAIDMMMAALPGLGMSQSDDSASREGGEDICKELRLDMLHEFTAPAEVEIRIQSGISLGEVVEQAG